MRKSTEKILSLLLALMLVVGVTPLGALTAYAANAKDEKALITAVNKGGDVKLTKDIALAAELIIPDGKTVTLDLNGKILSRSLDGAQEHGSVIRVESGAALTVTDGTNFNAGTITGGAALNGGGICNAGTLLFDGGTVEGNTAQGDTDGNGGGIYNSGTLTLRGGIIRNNAARNGGGIFNADGGTMAIEQNVITKKAGIESVTRYTNVTVSGNEAENLGHGVYNDGEMSLAEAPVINDNGDHDIYNPRGTVITIKGELTYKKPICIKTSGINAIITKDYSLYNAKKPTAFFTSSDNKTVIKLSATENGEVSFANEMTKTLLEVYENKKLIKKEEYDKPADAWTKALSYAKDNEYIWGFSKENSVVEITLGADWTCGQALEIAAKKNIVVDLNGFCIKRDGKKKKNGYLFKVGEKAMLKIYDSNPNSTGYKNHKGGVIADGNGDDCGGGIIVEQYAQFRMNGGTLYNCITDEHGGAIYATGKQSYVILKDCTIDACKTKDSGDDCHGGGIYATQTSNLNLNNVTIKNCESEDKGGAIYLKDKPGYVCLKNVLFSGNSANDGGGAIFIDDLSSDKEFEFVAENCFFTGNSAKNRGGAVYVNDDDESEYRNPTAFIDCTFKENESTHNGSAIEVNDNGVVLSGGTITGNTTKEKGAVYVEDKYDITVGGKLIIKDNKGKSGNQNLVLEKDDKKAYVYDAGLYSGSEIYISTSNGDTGFAGGKEISEYQSKYFHPEKGTLKFKKTGTAEAKMITTASLFGEGSRNIILTLLGLAVLVIVAALVIKKKKGVYDDDDEDEE